MTPRIPDASELAEDLAEIKTAVYSGSKETREALADLARRVETTYVRGDVYGLAQTAMSERMKNVEERHTWLSRTAITALVLPVLVAVIVAIFLSSGGIR